MALKPDLLYVTPVLPALTGNGLAMRAGAVLEALAVHYRVSLHVVPLYSAPDAELALELETACVAFDEGTHRPFPGRRFDVVHAFRLAGLPFARLADAGERHVDLDDVETQTLRRIAALRRSNGGSEEAELLEREADRNGSLEEEALSSWDRVYVASERDRDALTAGARAEVRVLPNTVRLPVSLPERAPGEPAFLFVGNLGYYPNEDAVAWLCEAVLPELRRLVEAPFRIAVVGGGAVGRIAEEPEVLLGGAVPDVGPWYAEADVVLVPLRAGGGTRIKILEAFAHRRPVVSTPVGAEGLAVSDGEQLLLGETAAELAAACSRLMTDQALAPRLTEQAHRLLVSRHTVDAAARAVDPAGTSPG